MVVTILTSAISLFVLERMSLHYLREGYRAKLLSITTTVGTMLDPGLLGPGQAEPLRLALRRARDANRRPDTQMKRGFVVTRSAEDPSIFLILSDAEENSHVAGRAGEVYRSAKPLGDISKA